MEKETILVVDDNQQINDFFTKKVLPELGYSTLSATSGKQALELIDNNQIDLILLDLQLPDTSGLEILERLSSKNRSIPTILITAHGSEQVAVEAFRLGVQDYLSKPVDIDTLNKSIAHALTESRLVKERAYLTAQLKEQVSNLKVLSKIGQSVTSTLEIDEVLRRIVEAGVYLTRAEEGFLALLDKQSGQLYLRVVKNVDETRIKKIHLPINDSLISNVIASKRSLRISKPPNTPGVKVSTGIFVNSLIHAPLLSKDISLGVISVDNHIGNRPFSEKDELILCSLADYASVAIENAHLYQQMQQELSERKFAEEKLMHDAFYDSLTGLPNRSLFIDHLSHAIERTKRHKESMFAVLYLDLDRFKDINDSHGHLIGDQLLIATGKMLTSGLRTIDTVARLGGDEFAILIEDISDISGVLRIATWIQDELKSRVRLLGYETTITASIGIALSVTGYYKPEDILRDADIAMYSAKAKGKARYEFFDPSMREQILQRLKLEADLRLAFERGEFRVYYQPLLSIPDCTIIGVEALIRWQHPEHGMIFPFDFINVLEETGLIIKVGEWVLKTACIQVRTWHYAGYSNIQLAVNISAHQFEDENLPELIQKVLTSTGIEPHLLSVEIPEWVAMKDIPRTIKTLKLLRDKGVHSMIDDFGNGYSSLGYLKSFPTNVLKIDRSFITGIPQNSQDSAIYKAMITMSHVLGLQVVAEGVETEEQFQFLSSQNCDMLQGFLFSPAISAEAITDLLKEKQKASPTGNT